MADPRLINLDPYYYVDRGVHRRERAAIFRSHWQMLGPTSQVAAPGQYLAATAAGWKLLVIRGRDGALRAFHNVCRHRGAPLLAEGTGRCDVLRCPYHLWLYDETGRLRRAPAFGEDAGFRPEEWSLTPVAVAQWRGLLFAAIEPEMSLLEQLGDLPAELAETPIEDYTLAAEARFDIRCNWKTYTDNFVEGYHVPGIHPSFSKVIDFARFETVALHGMVRMRAPQKEGSIYGGTWLWMWPNWSLSLFPGGMNTSRIDPVGADKAQLIYHFYFADMSAGTAAARQRTIETNCGIVREDFGICEQTQLNYVSGAYRPGPLSPRHEQSVAYFQAKVIAALEGGGDDDRPDRSPRPLAVSAG